MQTNQNPIDILFTVQDVKKCGGNFFELTLYSDVKLPKMHCGQFIHLKLKSKATLLRRPFCLYKFDSNTITLLIAIVGSGTMELSNLCKGEKIMGIVPIGNGFTLEQNHKNIALIGGGVGVAPLLSVTKCYSGKNYKSFLGFSDKSCVLCENEFKKEGEVFISTDNGSYGYKGFVTDLFYSELKNYRPDIILTCGPTPMMKAVAKISLEHKIPAFMSCESRMACGVGACLVCACAIRQADGSVKNLRGCVDGPVFSLEDIIL